MSLSSIQLEAFAEVARTGSFSKAAKNLHLTQSALSQRVLNLEGDLATALIVRDPSGLRLTPAGEELLRYCQVKSSLEAELMTRLSAGQEHLGGTIRIAGFSSVTRSVLMPALNSLIAGNPQINFEISSRELRDLPRALASNEVDYVLTTTQTQRREVQSHLVGYEVNVLVGPRKAVRSAEVYLDHDTDDTTTAEFFALNQQPTKVLNRAFVDDVYGILEGVRLGWGLGVLPKHLIKGDSDLKQIKGYEALKIPVMLQYYRQPYYSKLHDRIVSDICSAAAALLLSHV